VFNFFFFVQEYNGVIKVAESKWKYFRPNVL